MIKINSDNFDQKVIKKTQDKLYDSIIYKINENQFKKKLLEKLFKIFSKNKKDFSIEKFVYDIISLEDNILNNEEYFIQEYIVLCEMMHKLNSVTTRQDRISAIDELVQKSQILDIAVFIPHLKEITESAFLNLYINNDQNFKKYLSKKLLKKIMHVNNFLEKIFSYTTHIYPLREDILIAMKIKVCPYCNETLLHTKENYHETIGKIIKQKTLADLDHFFIQSHFPLLALSLSNFIPSCLNCNRTLKGQNISDLSNPRVEDFGSLAVFKTDIAHPNLNFENIKITFEIDSSILPEVRNKITRSVNLFNIETRYNHDEIKKDAVYLVGEYKKLESEFYRKFLESVNEKYKSYSDERIRHDAFRIDFPMNELVNNRLGKFRIDLLNQLLNYT